MHRLSQTGLKPSPCIRLSWNPGVWFFRMTEGVHREDLCPVKWDYFLNEKLNSRSLQYLPHWGGEAGSCRFKSGYFLILRKMIQAIYIRCAILLSSGVCWPTKGELQQALVCQGTMDMPFKGHLWTTWLIYPLNWCSAFPEMELDFIEFPLSNLPHAYCFLSVSLTAQLPGPVTGKSFYSLSFV